MRNLHLRKKFRLDDQPVRQPLTACAWDNGANSVICAYGPSKENPLLAVARWEPDQTSGKNANLKNELITSFDAPCPLPDLECDKILSLYFLPEKSTVCLVLAGGDIILVRESPLSGEEKIEIVGSVDVGITAAEWSPDGELLVLTTRADTLLLMTRELENSASVDLVEDDLKASKHVAVGWGKKETQFTGRGARALRDPTMPEKVDEGVQSKFDEGDVTISWRGDGQFFAVNSRQASDRRVIRVYSREGVLDGVSEPVDNLEAALSWRPAGNLIAGIQRHENRTDVVFFERNGLRHGEFTLRFPLADRNEEASSKIPNYSLEWNCDSTVLAVSFKNTIQLWTMGNYHWYLKQEIVTGASGSAARPALSWDPEHPLRYAFVESNYAEINQYALVATRSLPATSKTGLVAVIDGKLLKLTALRYANVPPPMAQVEIEMDCSIADVHLVYDDQIEWIAVVTTDGTVQVASWDPRKPSTGPQTVYKAKSPQIPSKGTDCHPRYRVRLRDKNTMALFADGAKIEISLKDTDDALKLSEQVLAKLSTSLAPQDVATIPPQSIHQLCTIAYDGKFESAPSDATEMKSSVEMSLSAPGDFDQVEVANVPTTASSGTEDTATERSTSIVFSLTRTGGLYANRKILARDATSFAVTPAHLIYTTSKHMLKFVHLVPEEQLIIPPDTPELDERCRAIERGARIVTVISQIAAVVLQMPRGNLETIFPRALVLAEIRRHIDAKEYKKAFMVCRKQRVDMNIIHDYKPEQLLANASLFVDQIQKVEHIDLFLSQLRDEDVSVTMYKDTLPSAEAERIEAEHQTRQNVAGKVNSICDSFLPVLRTKTSTKMQNIITAHVCKSPPDIDAGLTEVAELQQRGEAAGERAVEHICFLVDVNRLYDNALGLYNLDLALLVAQQSQKDPREYLPFLQRLRDLPDQRRKFAIDDHLNRHKKALADLWELDEFEEYEKYVIKHDLYEHALAACRYDETKYKAVMLIYADWLLRHSRYFDSGIAYEYLGASQQAAEAFRLAHCWREALSNAALAGSSAEELSELGTILADSLIESKDYHSAAIIHSEYLQDVASAARLFCRGNWFSDAIRLLSIPSNVSLLPDIVDTGLTENMGSTTELLAECKAQLNAQVPRLRELRIKKAEEPLAFFEGTGDGADIPDNISLAATDASTMGGSLFTRYTGKTGTVATNATRRTAKNRRREERRRARGKKGSVYEEEYLVNSIGRLIERVNSVGEETQRLVVGLMRRGMRERARAVDTAMRELVGLCNEVRDEVFQVEAPTEEQGAALKLANGANGVSGEDADEAPPEKIEPPVVRKFEGLSLLGGG